MPQTSTIAAALLIGYVVFVTVRGELPAYLCVVGIGANCKARPGIGSTGTASALSGAGPLGMGSSGSAGIDILTGLMGAL